jgi:catechol 2,3-dioxygenase-like lactoylglutathione lyase family enzyme
MHRYVDRVPDGALLQPVIRHVQHGLHAEYGKAEIYIHPETRMKRFHIHIRVDDLPKSVAFYSRLFAADPARVETDYAKWMLDDPRVNFAISTRGDKAGLDHLGFQADDAAELLELKTRANLADMPLLDEGKATCCYAISEKHWVTDPQGIAWEHFHTLESSSTFGIADAAAACCTPAVSPLAAANHRSITLIADTTSNPSCCGPTASTSSCC